MGPTPDTAYLCSQYRLGQYASLLLLLGGRERFESATRGTAIPSDKAPGVIATTYDPAAHGDSPVKVFQRFNWPDLNITHLGTELSRDPGQVAGLFVHALFNYSSYAHHAQCQRICVVRESACTASLWWTRLLNHDTLPHAQPCLGCIWS